MVSISILAGGNILHFVIKDISLFAMHSKKLDKYKYRIDIRNNTSLFYLDIEAKDLKNSDIVNVAISRIYYTIYSYFVDPDGYIAKQDNIITREIVVDLELIIKEEDNNTNKSISMDNIVSKYLEDKKNRRKK